MKIERHGDIVKLWLDAEDTRRWARRPGDLWPCSYIAGKTLFAEFHCGSLVDYALNDEHGHEALDAGSDEFFAITTDFITGRTTCGISQ